MSIIIFIIILAILIFVHELGHFLVAKKAGIRVDEFGLGFPPRLFTKKWGETTYTLNAIPFGGYVKIFGEDSNIEQINETERSKNFQYKPKWVQASVLVAGVTFNLIFAWLLISIGFMIGMPSAFDYSNLDNKNNLESVYIGVLQDSPAQKVGLMSGDKIISLSSDRQSLKTDELIPEKIRELIDESQGEVEVIYERQNNSPVTVSVKPEYDSELERKTIGIMIGSQIVKLPIHWALIEGVHTTWLLTKETTIGLTGFLWKTITFRSNFSEVAGPVGIAGMVSQANNSGFIYLLFLVALISINLTIINLLPFPALDGGRLLFVAIETIIRRPINPVFVRWANGVGFALLILLMIIITGHDIFKLI